MRPGYRVAPVLGTVVFLVAAGAAAIGASDAPAEVRPPLGQGFGVRNQSVLEKVPVPFKAGGPAPLHAIRLTAVRNGTFTGQVIVSDDKPIKGLKVEASALDGPTTIPASAVRVRYGVADGFINRFAVKPTWYDSLNDEAPGEVKPDTGGRAVLPVWVTVTVPADAKAAPAGEYTGSLTVRAEGVRPVAVPMKLRVFNWTLPPVDKFALTMDIIQSPETVAMAYEVPLWSAEHFALLDRTFSLLGPMGAKTLYITAVRRTHFGNEHAMVRWVSDDEGDLTPDLSVVEKYLDVAMKHIPHPRGVILYCWEPQESQGHAGVRPLDKPVLLTVVDPDTGETLATQGPALGSAESKPFWKRLTDGLQAVLKKRGLEKAMLFGLIGDSRPTKLAMDDMANGMAGRDRWALHSHLFCNNWQGHDVALVNALWGIGVQPADPGKGYAFGWSNPLWLSYYPREMHVNSPLVEYRAKLETWMGARRGYTPFIAPGTGARGLGRLGGDFWKVAKNRRGRVRYTLAGIYPEAAWGQLNLNFCISHLLGRGPKGALPTVRSEALRLGLQEAEVRVYVEKAWLDPEAKALLGDDLMARIRAALDERIRSCLGLRAKKGRPKVNGAAWDARTETLFSLAAEISKRLGREPRPNLAPRATLDGPAITRKR